MQFTVSLFKKQEYIYKKRSKGEFMKHYVCFIIGIAAFFAFGAQKSGFFIEVEAVKSTNVGDTLWYFRGNPAGSIGAIDRDSLRTIVNGKEVSTFNGKDSIIWLRDDFPVNFQHDVRPSFSIGYEHSFNKVFSLRGAVGYLSSRFDVLSDTVISYTISGGIPRDTIYYPAADAEISSHWISIPLDIKIMIPIRRSGLYAAFGPKATILLSSKYKDNLYGGSYDFAPLIPHFNLMLGFKVGGEIAFTKIGHLFFEGGYHAGLINMSPISSNKSTLGTLTPFCMGFRVNLPK
jgi:hypothetical protein